MWVSPPAHAPCTSLISPPFSWTLREHMSVCVWVWMCVCVCRLNSLCLRARSAGWFSVSITSSVFATLNHTAALSVCYPSLTLHPSPSSPFHYSQVSGSGWGALAEAVQRPAQGNNDDNKAAGLALFWRGFSSSNASLLETLQARRKSALHIN